MKSLVIVSLLLLGGCGASLQTYGRYSGSLASGSTLSVVSNGAEIDAYKPKNGQSAQAYTVLESAPKGVYPPTSDLQPSAKQLRVNVSPFFRQVLVRVPNGVALRVRSSRGNVNVTDISGPSDVVTDAGEVKIMVPGYAQARSGNGSVTVYMGATQWPGTLHFGSSNGDTEVWINETAQFGVHLHTDRGTIFTDFPLTGTSHGLSETINDTVGPPHPRQWIDITVHNGGIRLLQLKPQV